MGERKRYAYGIEYRTALEMACEQIGLKTGPMAAVRGLLTFLNKDSGLAYPNKKTLALRIGGGERSARRYIAYLESIGLIEAVSYRTGGQGRATVWKFTLPAWTTPSNYPAKLAEYRQQYPANLSIYPANLSNYPANLAAQPDKNQIRTGKKAAPSRREDGPSAFEPWDGREYYPYYIGRRKAFEKERASARAENEKGGEILADAPKGATA